MSGANKKAAEQTDYSFLLFVAGDEPNSVVARKNLSSICEKHLAERYAIRILDVFEDFSEAIDNGIIVTPTLILQSPDPRVTIFGNLSDTAMVLTALRLKGDAN